MNLKRTVRKALPPGLLTTQSALRALVSQSIRGLPARRLNVIGVTGTDGKSSTCLIIASLLRSAGLKTALLSTIAVDFADGRGMRPSPKHMTTAGNWQMADMLSKVKRAQPDWLVMEVSSHALDQRRVLGVPFSIAVMTNLSPEHLDYHRDMKSYLAAKLKLFGLTNRNKRGLRLGIVNADDASALDFTTAIANSVTYGIEGGEVRADKLDLTSQASNFEINFGNSKVSVKSKLLGKFNVYNALAAAAATRAAGLSDAQIKSGFAGLEAIPGRMQPVDLKTGYQVLIDYAVTPNALEKALQAARQLAGKGRVILVFGATGDRDKSKRASMGEVAARGADKIFLTDDETYTEDPTVIRHAVYRGIESAGGSAKAEEVAERKDAIAAALEDARRGDVVLITGLGHQTTRNMGGKDVTWNDAEVVRKLTGL